MTRQGISTDVSRRELLTGGLAGGFLLAFHVPVRAVNELVRLSTGSVISSKRCRRGRIS